jgi:hypothetical protein
MERKRGRRRDQPPWAPWKFCYWSLGRRRWTLQP